MGRAAALTVICLFGSIAADAQNSRELTNSIGIKFVRIEPGSFTMGQDGPPTDYRMVKHPEKFDDADWDERPAHRVTLTRSFHLSTTEITVGQYRAFKPGFRPTEPADNALTNITWDEAIEFTSWLSIKEDRTYRLPTEAEWEYACRAGTTTLFHTGDVLPDGFQPWLGDTATRDRNFAKVPIPPVYRTQGPRSLRVAQTPPNAWGLYDMHGNVAEWCLDWYGPYEAGDQTNPIGRAEGDFRIFRGGHQNTFIRQLRSANRAAWLPQAKSRNIGFRLALGSHPVGSVLPAPAVPLNAQQVSQTLPKIQALPAEVPHFEGPQSYVKVPPDSFGPLFSTHNHSPGIVECPNGDLLAVWYACVEEPGPELNNVASRLRLGAKEWEPCSPFWDGADINDHGPKIWWDGEKTLFHFVRGQEENLFRKSTDNGATWSQASLIHPVGEFGNQPIRLKDGTLVITNDARNCSLVYSKDEGKTWSYNLTDKLLPDLRPGGSGSRYPGIHAPIVQLANGSIMALSRNDPPEDQAKFDGKTPISITTDLGKTWTYASSEFPAISSVQRAAMIRLREGPILVCTFTDQWRDWKSRKGLTFKAAGEQEFTGFGMYAALSFDEGKTWPVRRLITPGGAERQVNSIDRVMFALSDTMSEPCGYLSMTQARDGRIHLITSRNHYAFNLAWLKQLPTKPTP